jgi:uncharacterized protein YbjT (DUF2867 family)
MKIRAILTGATGMVGEGVLLMALAHPDVEAVLVVGRRPCGVNHPKLTEIVHGNLADVGTIRSSLSGYNACFFCLGTSSIGMNEEEYRAITYDLTMGFATTVAAVNPDMTFCYVSGAGTDGTEQGRLGWARIKGKTENDLKRLPFKSVLLLRPAFIKPVDGQKHAFTIAKILGAIYPFLKTIFPKHVGTMNDLGLAMIRGALRGLPTQVLENNDIARVANTYAEQA